MMSGLTGSARLSHLITAQMSPSNTISAVTSLSQAKCEATLSCVLTNRQLQIRSRSIRELFSLKPANCRRKTTGRRKHLVEWLINNSCIWSCSLKIQLLSPAQRGPINVKVSAHPARTPDWGGSWLQTLSMLDDSILRSNSEFP